MKKLKKFMVLIVFFLLLLAVSCFIAYSSKKKTEGKIIKIGVSVYRASDTFIASIIHELENAVIKKEQEENITIILDISDGKENQTEQNEQVERYIALEYDVICVNLVDRTNASILIDKAVGANIPIIFFNREPVEEDIFRNDQIYYIGSDAKKSAEMQGNLILEAYEENPESIDKNGDGVIEYVMVEGEAGHQDTIIRTEYSVKTLESSGLKLKKAAGFIANFDRNQSAALVENWLQENPLQRVELFISNNDDMALGVVDALERLKMPMIPIVGIDGIPQGIEAVKEHKMLGTAVSDAGVYAENIFELAFALSRHTEIPKTIKLENERYVWIPWKMCTIESLEGQNQISF